MKGIEIKTTKQLMKQLDLTKRTCLRRIHEGKIPGYVKHELVAGAFLIYVKPSKK